MSTYNQGYNPRTIRGMNHQVEVLMIKDVDEYVWQLMSDGRRSCNGSGLLA